MPTIITITTLSQDGRRSAALVGLAHIVAIIPNLDLNGLWTHSLVHLAGGLTLRSDMRPETLRSLISTARGA